MAEPALTPGGILRETVAAGAIQAPGAPTRSWGD